MRGCWLLAPLVLMACGGGSVDVADETAAGEQSQADTVAVTMPAYPALREGYLSGVTSAALEANRFRGSWPVEAGLCREPTVVQVLARGDSIGSVVFVGPSPGDSVVGEYSIVDGRYDLPDTSRARVALQAYAGRNRSMGFQAVRGTVEIQRADSVIAGRLAVALFEERFQDSVYFAASFQGPLRPAPQEWCAVFGREPQEGTTPVRLQPGRR
jgi:hypothetical protein